MSTHHVVRSALCLALVGAFAIPAHAVTITQWNFNSSPPDSSTATGLNTPSTGAGTITTVGGVSIVGFNSGTGSSDPAASDNSGFQTSSYVAQSTGDKTAGIQVNVSTAGYSNIMVKFDQRHSNTSSRYAQFQYSTNGTTFTDFGSLLDASAGGDTWYNNRSLDLSSIPGVSNLTTFAFRVVAAFAPSTTAYAASTTTSSYATTGTWRFDMVTVSGDPIVTAVPVPGSFALLATALLGFGVVVRRNRAG
jgi:hypothetical protein